MKQSQKDWTIEQLEKYGSVSRNNALSNFISRLGAIILVLKHDGWAITGEWEGGDFVYSLKSKPVEKIDERLQLSRQMAEKMAVFD